MSVCVCRRVYLLSSSFNLEIAKTNAMEVLINIIYITR